MGQSKSKVNDHSVVASSATTSSSSAAPASPSAASSTSSTISSTAKAAAAESLSSSSSSASLNDLIRDLFSELISVENLSRSALNEVTDLMLFEYHDFAGKEHGPQTMLINMRFVPPDQKFNQRQFEQYEAEVRIIQAQRKVVRERLYLLGLLKATDESMLRTTNQNQSEVTHFTQAVAPILWSCIERALAIESSKELLTRLGLETNPYHLPPQLKTMPFLLLPQLIKNLRTCIEKARIIFNRICTQHQQQSVTHHATPASVTLEQMSLSTLLETAGYIGAFDLIIPLLMKSHSLIELQQSLNDQLFSMSLWTPSTSQLIDCSSILPLFDYGLSPSVVSSRYSAEHELDRVECVRRESEALAASQRGEYNPNPIYDRPAMRINLYDGLHTHFPKFLSALDMARVWNQTLTSSTSSSTSSLTLADATATALLSSSSSESTAVESDSNDFHRQLLSHWSSYVHRVHAILLEVDPATLIPPIVSIIRVYVDCAVKITTETYAIDPAPWT